MWPMAKRPAQTRRKTEGNNNATAKDAGPSAAAWPERSSMARAQQHGPSAAKWPERRDMARAPRHGPSAARAAEARARRVAVEAETRASPGHRPRPCANWLKTLVRKFEKLLIGIKRKFRMF